MWHFASKSFRTQRLACSFNNGARMKTLIAALGILAIGTGANVGSALALEVPGRALVASAADADLQIASDPVLSGNPGSSVHRSFIPPYSGTVRIKWEVRSGDGTTPVFSNVEVVHVSACSRPSSSGAFVQKFCNLRVAGGVPITLTAVPDENTNVASVRNVRLYYRVVNSRGEAIIYEVPLQ